MIQIQLIMIAKVNKFVMYVVMNPDRRTHRRGARLLANQSRTSTISNIQYYQTLHKFIFQFYFNSYCKDFISFYF